MKLTKIIEMSLYPIDIVEYYNENLTFLYSFEIDEIPEDCQDKVSKFNIYNSAKGTVLEIIEKK